MEYYTEYMLSMRDANVDDVERIYKYAERNGMEFHNVFEIPYGDFYSWDTRKWYDHDKEMLQISKEFPHILFCLHGEGVEFFDIWEKYYQNGKMSVCKAEIPPYDPEKMEEVDLESQVYP